MSENAGVPALVRVVAQRLRDARVDLASRWLERISERVALAPDRVFPTDALLDHVPLLIIGIADVIEDPRLSIAADSDVMKRAMELGALRHEQGFTEYEILKEFEIFGAIVFAFLERVAAEVDGPAIAWAQCSQRLFRAVTIVQQATTVRYFELMSTRVREREERLRAFHRALTHELRNRIGAVLGAAQILGSVDLVDDEWRTLMAVVARNARSMSLVLENLLELARVDVDARQQRRVLLSAAVEEAARQLRDAAAADGVEIRIAETLPPIEVSAAAVELTLVNLLSNAIKYRDRTQPRCFAEVTGHVEGDELVVRVRDNGRGVAPEARDALFQRFFRAHVGTAPDIEGTGLGLSIVREVMRGAGGRTWAEFPDKGGSVFAFALPARRTEDNVIPNPTDMRSIAARPE